MVGLNFHDLILPPAPLSAGHELIPIILEHSAPSKPNINKMVLAKSKNSVGLGNSLMNDRFGKGKGSDRKKVTTSGIHRINHATGETYVTNERKEASWVKMRSVTEQAALDEFLSTAELAGTDFTAEKMNNVKIIHTDQKNPFLLSAAEERAAVGKQKEYKNRLTVPRRPKWHSNTSPEQLDTMERESFLEWRRGLAELQENNDLLMTPFERNLEVWRQLWRVIERSDLIVQIVDARNPLLFRSEDLESYVKDIDAKKKNLLLVNKADLLNFEQRLAWAEYFQAAGISYKFFSASIAKEMNEARDFDLDSEDKSEKSEPHEAELLKKASGLEIQDDEEREESEVEDEKNDNSESEDEDEEEATRILTVDELENLFISNVGSDSNSEQPKKIQIGLVGYPNVGKSSTINALIGAKKVSVSSTPGKTKHFQTIHLSEKVLLCDCPGLVFPNFATTKAELVCNGILPIDQLREFTGPVGLIAKRIPQSFLEVLYGIKISTKPQEEGGTGVPTAEEILSSYAKARGFTRTGQGQPDESRAARYILKDYVNGKLLFCQPPPNVDPQEFNVNTYDVEQLPEKHRQAFLAMHKSPDDQLLSAEPEIVFQEQGSKSKKLDSTFFAPGKGNLGHYRMPFNHKYSEQGTASGKLLSGRKQKTLLALEKDMDPKDIKMLTSKKHFKNGKKGNGKRRQDYFAD
ncbi:Large subunit GTPase 1 [Podosphaera aphanis]|nr:Large subunit GTPase 1 [Podosphaera aphanis]